MEDILLNTIEKKIATLNANSKLSKKDFEKENMRIKKLLSFSEYSEEKKASILLELESIGQKFVEVKPTLEEASPRFISIPKTKLDEIKDQIKKTAPIFLGAVGVTLCLYACSLKGMNNDDFVPTVNGNYIEIENPVDNKLFETFDTVATIQTDVMSEETKAMADEIVLAMNDAILKGFNVTEENKETMAKLYSEYYMLNQMNELSDFEWGTIFPETNVSAKDLMNAKYSLETIDEKRITVSTKDGMLDYSLLFNETDAKFLNDGSVIISKINSTSGTERKEAVSEFYDFIINNLETTENRMQYSELALDTFRSVMFEAFDQLTNHKVIDDELEHAINTVYINCKSIDDTDKMSVQDPSITSLQSIFQTYMITKLDERLEAGRIAIDNEIVNEHDSIDEISKYVSENINLQLYTELADYETYLEKLFLVSTPSKSKDDSGVSNGKGGAISSEQLNQYGIDPNSATVKTDLEAAVQTQFEKNEEANKTITDSKGNVVGTGEETKEALVYWTQKGATDCNNNIYSNTAPDLYKVSYDTGWNAANISKQQAILDSKNQGTTYTEPVTNGTTTTSETITEVPYTGTPAVDPNVTITEEFVPLTESTVTYDYTSSIKELNFLKNELFAMSSVYDDTKSIKM